MKKYWWNPNVRLIQYSKENSRSLQSFSIWPGPFYVFSDVSDHEFIADEEKCCVCDKLEPEQLKFNSYVAFVRLGQCQCEQFVHTPPYQGKVIRMDTQITCPSCVWLSFLSITIVLNDHFHQILYHVEERSAKYIIVIIVYM